MKIKLCLVLCFTCFVSSVVFADDAFKGSNFTRLFEPRCNQKQTICTLGKFKISDKKNGVYIGDGVICNAKKTRCTNGILYIRSNKPLY